MRELPAMDQGALALRVREGKAELVRLPLIDPEQNVTRRKVSATLSRGGVGELSVEYESTGNAASGWRSRYEAKGTQDERIAKDMAAEYPGFELTQGSLTTGDLTNLSVPPRVGFRGKAPQYGRPEGELLSVDVTVSARLSSQYASRSARTQDLKITGFSNRRESVAIELPVGMQVQSAPVNADEKGRFGSYRVDYRKQGSNVTIDSELLLFVDRVKPGDYAEFQRFCGRADAALGHRLVLEPVSGGAR
jgi:hypothetical protein